MQSKQIKHVWFQALGSLFNLLSNLVFQKNKELRGV